ncbi:hypothetical protein EC988_010189, partial [Linderina pennispora]
MSAPDDTLPLGFTRSNDTENGPAADESSFTARGILGAALRRPQHSPESLDIGAQKMHISNVSITGATRIRRSVFNEIVAPAFAATTVKGAIEELRYAAGKLELLGIAKRVQINLDKADDDGVGVSFDCEDGGRYAITTGVGA